MVSPISRSAGSTVMPPPPLKPEEVFAKVDSTHKGFITESELASAIVQISPEGMSLSQADAQSMAKDAFAKMDANADGQVTGSEFKDAAPKGPPQRGGPGGRPGGPPPGPPPGGGPGGGKGAAASGSSTSNDAADTNQDGTVSDLERRAYSAKSQVANVPASSTTTQDPSI
jgi:hypothetical protein